MGGWWDGEEWRRLGDGKEVEWREENGNARIEREERNTALILYSNSCVEPVPREGCKVLVMRGMESSNRSSLLLVGVYFYMVIYPISLKLKTAAFTVCCYVFEPGVYRFLVPRLAHLECVLVCSVVQGMRSGFNGDYKQVFTCKFRSA